MNLPNKIFLIGVPGSRWSGIAQNIEDNIPGFNATDRTENRKYAHHNFSGHLGVYFGTGWEHGTELTDENLDSAFSNTKGTRFLKSHEWAYCLDEIKEKFPNDWIMLIHRPDLSAYSWWHEAGGFTISYPDYHPYYKDSINMLNEIRQMHQHMFDFSQKHNLKWSHISADWIEENFGTRVEPTVKLSDTLVTILK
jgi:hypothetical protein